MDSIDTELERNDAERSTTLILDSIDSVDAEHGINEAGWSKHDACMKKH